MKHQKPVAGDIRIILAADLVAVAQTAAKHHPATRSPDWIRENVVPSTLVGLRIHMIHLHPTKSLRCLALVILTGPRVALIPIDVPVDSWSHWPTPTLDEWAGLAAGVWEATPIEPIGEAEMKKWGGVFRPQN